MSSYVRKRDRHRIRVYIAGPMTNGGGGYNASAINEAIRTHLRLIPLGFVSHCPQLTAFAELMFPGRVSYSDWLSLDKNYIDDCDVVLRLPGESKGADSECLYARSRSIPVIHGIGPFLAEYKEAFVCSGM